MARRDTVLTAPGYESSTLGAFLEWLGIADVCDEGALPWPTIEIGQDSDDAGSSRAIRPWADGWSFGIGSGSGGFSTFLFAPACVAAGALAVSEAFSLLRRDNPYAGRRRIALSLWSPASGAEGAGPADVPSIPSSWVVGLGHLGQPPFRLNIGDTMRIAVCEART